MIQDFYEDSRIDSFEQMLGEIRARLKLLTPRPSQLAVVARRLPGTERGLERWEVEQLSRGLERVWHIMRLLRLLTEYFGDKLFFGGGSILNYVYMVKFSEPPRLTFDLDSAWCRRVPSKRVILKEMVGFNRWLVENGLTPKIPLSRDRVVELFIVEYDRDKDFFPELLSLRIPVITRYDGEPFHEFLGIQDYGVIMRLRRVFKEVLGVKDPRIDYIRFEVSLDPGDMPRENAILEDIFGSRTQAWITRLEYQLASKITYKVAKDFGPDLNYNLHDILKAVLDLRLLRYANAGAVKHYAGSIDNGAVKRNLDALQSPAGRRVWEKNHHYILARRRYALEDLAEQVKTLIIDATSK